MINLPFSEEFYCETAKCSKNYVENFVEYVEKAENNVFQKIYTLFKKLVL